VHCSFNSSFIKRCYIEIIKFKTVGLNSWDFEMFITTALIRIFYQQKYISQQIPSFDLTMAPLHFFHYEKQQQ